MRTFLLIFLAGYAVRCDDSYYVVQRPNTETREFNVYWNVPTVQCKSKKIHFDNLFEKYGIIQNAEDTYRGNKISILYDPGNFPALIKNETTGEIKYRNGGVPQQGDVMAHLEMFKHELVKSIVDANYSGLGIIDFESWRPILRQNFGILTPYKDVSFEIEQKKHWWWKVQWLQEEAQHRFEAAARDFMQTTIALAKRLRPNALWGYYGYPQCFNRPINNNPEKCAPQMAAENDQIDWLWTESTALYPSVYSSKDMSTVQLAAFIKGRIKESVRVRNPKVPILPYWWFRYRDGGFFSKTDLEISLTTFYKSNASGIIIWGSSKDVNTREKCTKLESYLTKILGPAVARYTKRNTDSDDGELVTRVNPLAASMHKNSSSIKASLDADYNWDPPKNYSQIIEGIVDEGLKNDSETNKNKKKEAESLLIDLILHRMAHYCSSCMTTTDPGSISEKEILTTQNPFKDTEIKIGDIMDDLDVVETPKHDNSDIGRPLINFDSDEILTIAPLDVKAAKDDSSIQYDDSEIIFPADVDATTTTNLNLIQRSAIQKTEITTKAPKAGFHNYAVLFEELNRAFKHKSNTFTTSTTSSSVSLLEYIMRKTKLKDVSKDIRKDVKKEVKQKKRNKNASDITDMSSVLHIILDELYNNYKMNDQLELELDSGSKEIGDSSEVRKPTTNRPIKSSILQYPFDYATERSIDEIHSTYKRYFGNVNKYLHFIDDKDDSREESTSNYIDNMMEETTMGFDTREINTFDENESSLELFLQGMETKNNKIIVKPNIPLPSPNSIDHNHNHMVKENGDQVFIREVMGSKSRATTSCVAGILYLYLIMYLGNLVDLIS